MTISRERTVAVVRTEQFLLALCDTHKTPRVPAYIREQARALLRHYPTRLDMDAISMREAKVDATKEYVVFGRLP